MQIELTPELENLIRQQIVNGYRSPEDVIKAGLKLLQKQNQEKSEALRTDLLRAAEQLKNGEGRSFDAKKIKRLGREKAQRSKDLQ